MDAALDGVRGMRSHKIYFPKKKIIILHNSLGGGRIWGYVLVLKESANREAKQSS